MCHTELGMNVFTTNWLFNGLTLSVICTIPAEESVMALERAHVRLLPMQMNEGVVSKETVVLRRWGSSIQKFGFINGVDNVNWPPYRDSKS